MPPYHAHQWTAIHPTVIQHIVHANLLSDSQDCLVFAKVGIVGVGERMQQVRM